MFSYWEKDFWSKQFDFAIIGAGFTGLNVALNLKTKFPNVHILVIDKQVQFATASTKNAGFACFGSPSEILHDLKIMGEEQCLALVEKRKRGISIIKENFGAKEIEFESCDAFEWFLKNKSNLFGEVESNIGTLNKLLGKEPTYTIQANQPLNERLVGRIKIKGEGQLHPAKLHGSLLKRVRKMGVEILNNADVQGFGNNCIDILGGLQLKATQIVTCTNGLTKLIDKCSMVKPARAQVLLSSEIDNLPFKGNYHIDEGFYYFRNVGKRLLLGGARNEDFEGETTYTQGLNHKIQDKLAEVLDMLLPDKNYTIDQRWSGIMGMLENKNPVIENRDGNIYLVGMSGMGVALAFSMSKELVEGF